MADSCTKQQRETIARGPVCSIELCACGTLHLTIGPITLRLEAGAVESMWVTLSDALAKVAARNRDEPAYVASREAKYSS